jgi:hypothetical protein
MIVASVDADLPVNMGKQFGKHRKKMWRTNGFYRNMIYMIYIHGGFSTSKSST